MQQRTEEWFAARCGKVTASRMKNIIAKSDTAAYRNYQAEIISERLSGRSAESYSSREMQRGTELEPKARAVYLLETGSDVSETGLILHPIIANSGASPDGLVDSDGLLEIKCPNTATHIDFLLHRQPKREYILQMQWQMACTGRLWCDFVSYDDRLPEPHAYACIRIMRDPDTIERLEQAAADFLAEAEAIIKQLEQRP